MKTTENHSALVAQPAAKRVRRTHSKDFKRKFVALENIEFIAG